MWTWKRFLATGKQFAICHFHHIWDRAAAFYRLNGILTCHDTTRISPASTLSSNQQRGISTNTHFCLYPTQTNLITWRSCTKHTFTLILVHTAAKFCPTIHAPLITNPANKSKISAQFCPASCTTSPDSSMQQSMIEDAQVSPWSNFKLGAHLSHSDLDMHNSVRLSCSNLSKPPAHTHSESSSMSSRHEQTFTNESTSSPLSLHRYSWNKLLNVNLAVFGE